MPPKKGKKKKSGGKKGKKSGKSSGKTVKSATESEPKLSNEGKSNFLIQTKDLEKQINDLQRRCDDLEILNSMFEEEFEQNDQDKTDITEYLEQTLTIRNEEIARVKMKLEELQKNREHDNHVFEELIEQKQTDFDNIKEELLSEKRMKSGQLASMEEFKVQQEELSLKFEEIGNKIIELDDMNSNDVYQREKAAVIDMEKLKKEMAERVADVATEFRKVSNRQMAETNKKTIRDNVELSSKIKLKSEETMKLLQENERLRKIIDREQKYDLEISQTIEMDLQRKYHNNIKEIKKWVEECRAVEEDLENYESEEYRLNARQVQDEHQSLILQRQEHREELASLQSTSMLLEQCIKTNEECIAEEKQTLKSYRQLINRTKRSLIDAENLMDPEEEYTEGEVKLGRQKMLISLLDLLNSANDLGFGMVPGDLCHSRPNTNSDYSAYSESKIISSDDGMSHTKSRISHSVS